MSTGLRVLVIGGTRFIGRATVERLIAQGCDVTLFHRGETGAELFPGIAHIRGDRKSLSDHATQLRDIAPDVVLDMILLTEQQARDLVTVFDGHARRIVAISSCDVYRAYGRLIGTEPGPAVPVPLTEDSPLREVLYPYRGKIDGLDDYDKIPAERVCLGSDAIAGTVLRSPMVYGPHDRQRRFRRFIRRMDDNRPAILFEAGEAGWCGSYAFVGNVADAIVTAITDERAARRIYNVAEPDTLSQREWVDQLAQLIGWSGKVIELPTAEHLLGHDEDTNFAQDLSVDAARIREELQFTERIDRGGALRQTIDWEREYPPDKENLEREYAHEDALLAALAAFGE